MQASRAIAALLAALVVLAGCGGGDDSAPSGGEDGVTKLNVGVLPIGNAAPLILDLARLTAAAHRAGRTGPLTELAFFFKDPLGDVPHGLAEQWQALRAAVDALGARGEGQTTR